MIKERITTNPGVKLEDEWILGEINDYESSTRSLYDEWKDSPSSSMEQCSMEQRLINYVYRKNKKWNKKIIPRLSRSEIGLYFSPAQQKNRVIFK